MDIAKIRETTWSESVDQFVTKAAYLSDEDLPQLKALYGIAKILDGGGKIQASMVSQFTLTQRALAAKGAKSEPPRDPHALDALLDSDNPDERSSWLQSPM